MTREAVHTMSFNDRVRVTLTAYGARVLNNYNARLNERMPKALWRQDYAAGEVFEEQLWEMFNVFTGNYCGGEISFEGNRIEVIE